MKYKVGDVLVWITQRSSDFGHSFHIIDVHEDSLGYDWEYIERDGVKHSNSIYIIDDESFCIPEKIFNSPLYQALR